MAGIKDDLDNLTGSDLQASQADGESGRFGGNRDQQQSAQGGIGGQQMGGAAEGSDFKQEGGSSGTGGYGKAQNQQFHQGQEGAAQRNHRGGTGDRGADFDERQGGGRGSDSVSEDRGS